jgi:hypothetical protein
MEQTRAETSYWKDFYYSKIIAVPKKDCYDYWCNIS